MNNVLNVKTWIRYNRDRYNQVLLYAEIDLYSRRDIAYWGIKSFFLRQNYLPCIGYPR